MPDANLNQAPYPHALAELVEQCTYRKGWRFDLAHVDRGQGSIGLTLTITVHCDDSYDHERPIGVRHLMIVPAASYNRRSWRRWLFEQILLVERHEACEFFEVDGVKPYAPLHADGNDPYIVSEVWAEQDLERERQR